MHLSDLRPGRFLFAGVLLLGAGLLSGGAVAQQQPADQQKAMEAQPDPHVPPAAQPIDPQKAAERQAQDKAREQQKPKASANPAAPRSRSAQFTLPPLVAISEVPRGKAVMIQGRVLSPQSTTFILNDGNASMVINLGAEWQALSKVKPGDRVGVIGQMDPYGSPLFRATGIMLDTGKIVIIPNG